MYDGNCILYISGFGLLVLRGLSDGPIVIVSFMCLISYICGLNLTSPSLNIYCNSTSITHPKKINYPAYYISGLMVLSFSFDSK